MRVRAALLGLILVTVGLAGCMGGDGSTSVYIRDDPREDFDEVHVVFTHVYVHEAGGEDSEDGAGDNQTQDGDQQSGAPGMMGEEEAERQPQGQDGQEQGSQQFREEAGWHRIAGDEDGIDVNLLNATGTQAAFLGESGLDAGHYTHIAVVVDEAYGIDDQGERVDINLATDVGRVVQSFDVENNGETRIILDLDLENALTENDQGWLLTPVWGNTVVEQVDDGASGEDAHEPGEVADVGEA